MKLRQHSTRCSLCSTVKECGTNFEQIFFSANLFPKFAWPLPYRLQDVQLVAKRYLPVLHHNGASFLYIFIGPSGNKPAWARLILQGLPAFLKTCEPSEDLCTTQTVITVHRFWYTSIAVFPQFKAKFNHVMLLHVENFDTRNKHTLTLTAIKRRLLTLQRRVLVDKSTL
jgi:hypothetical protein